MWICFSQIIFELHGMGSIKPAIRRGEHFRNYKIQLILDNTLISLSVIFPLQAKDLITSVEITCNSTETPDLKSCHSPFYRFKIKYSSVHCNDFLSRSNDDSRSFTLK